MTGYLEPREEITLVRVEGAPLPATCDHLAAMTHRRHLRGAASLRRSETVPQISCAFVRGRCLLAFLAATGGVRSHSGRLLGTLSVASSITGLLQ